ncbi:unnamed protein product, partial [marine sediment metagenome]
GDENNKFYIKYLIARLAAFRNVWWSKGGVLYGKSPVRIRFLKEVLTASPFQEMSPDFSQMPKTFIFAKPGEHHMVYFTEDGKFEMDLLP